MEASDRGVPPGFRGVRLSAVPTLSVIVASHGSREQLDRCLERLLPQCQERAAELLVVRACSGPEADALRNAYPQVLVAVASEGATPAQLRAQGMRGAGGDIVVLIEDDHSVPEGWLDQWVRPPEKTSVATCTNA